MASREERSVLRTLSAQAGKALEILCASEQDELAITPALGRALAANPIHFVVFACLGTKTGTEEIVLDFNATIFMKKFRKQAKRLMGLFAAESTPTKLTIILPDLEPVRTWGWSPCQQEEVTAACELMADAAETTLPREWRVLPWSVVEDRYDCPDHRNALLTWAEHSAPELILRDEREFFKRFPHLHPDIRVYGTPNELARKQIAAYAYEGCVLERLYPDVVLLQTDTPVARKDAMFNLRRDEPLAIAHPFRQ